MLRGGKELSALGGAELERDPNVARDLLALYQIEKNDVFMIASNSGVNGSIVGVALAAKARGHKVIAVTSLEHTAQRHAQASERQAAQRSGRHHHRQSRPFGDSDPRAGGRHRRGRGILDHRSVHRTTHHHRRRRRQFASAARRRRSIFPPTSPEGDKHNRALEDLYGESVSAGRPEAFGAAWREVTTEALEKGGN